MIAPLTPEEWAGAASNQLPGPWQRVVVAMSGGVDSSVAAALLHERGCEVIGITMSLYEDPDPCGPEGGCCTPEDILDARRVCADLGIPHYLLNYRDAFEEAVIAPFVDAYRRGETPNPCARCNHHLKFDRLLRRALQLDAPWLATGHYARRVLDGQGRSRLLRGVDPAKDQSYFLYGTRSRALDRLCFPLGHLDKGAVRDHARRLGVRTSDKADSQDICFVTSGRAADFVERRGGGAASGPIVDEGGAELGRHDGIHRFTIGQRRGLGIAAPEPLYVTRIEAEANRVVVGPSRNLEVWTLRAREWNWIRPPAPNEGLLSIRIRYRSRSVPIASWSQHDDDLDFHLAEPARAAAPGQAAVAYGGPSGNEVLGGGTLCRPGALAVLSRPAAGAPP